MNLPYEPALGGANKANRIIAELLVARGQSVRAVVPLQVKASATHINSIRQRRSHSRGRSTRRRKARREGPRNQPCRQLFREAQFEEVAPGKYVLPELSRLPPIDPNICQVEDSEERPTFP